MLSQSLLRSAGVAVAAFTFIGCAAKPDYEKAGYSDAKIATPPHNMSAYEYPFDDDGTYRKDWVTNKSAQRERRRSSASAPTPTRTQAPPVMAQAPPQAYTPAPTPQQAYTPPPSRPAPAPTPAPAPKPAARYHTVAKGDTLFSLSRRYSVSVGQIKATNGLTSDLIRIGQTLRLP